jgi:hypothetical protein
MKFPCDKRLLTGIQGWQNVFLKKPRIFRLFTKPKSPKCRFFYFFFKFYLVRIEILVFVTLSDTNNFTMM